MRVVIEKEEEYMNELQAELRKIPPQQIEAEQSLLGGVIVDSSGLPSALEFLKGDEFYKDSHRASYSLQFRTFSKEMSRSTF